MSRPRGFFEKSRGAEILHLDSFCHFAVVSTLLFLGRKSTMSDIPRRIPHDVVQEVDNPAELLRNEDGMFEVTSPYGCVGSRAVQERK